MATITIAGAESYAPMAYIPRVYVQARPDWQSEWQWRPYVYALQASQQASPQGSYAVLAYDYGTILREDRLGFRSYWPIALNGWYVRLIIDNGWSDTLPIIWVGYVVDEEDDGGRQTFRAVGLEHFLETRIAHSWTRDGQIDRALKFNETGARGQGLIGNAYAPATPDETLTYPSSLVFGGKARWTNLDIIKYLISRALADSPVPWLLSGLDDDGSPMSNATHMLADRYEVHDLYGMTVREALDRLIDRRLGVGWRVRTTPEGYAYIEPFSLFDSNYHVGEKHILPNESLTELALDGLLDIEPRIRFSDLNRWDKVIVRGGPIYSTATWCAIPAADEYAPLKSDWPYALEQDYQNAADDDERRSERFETVYCRFRVPQDWDWTMGGHALVPTIEEDGTCNFAVPGVAHWPGHVFERELPLPTNKETGLDVDREDLRRPLLFCFEPESQTYQLLDRLIVDDQEYPTPFYFSDRELAFTIRPRINHLFASLHWTPPEGATDIEPVIAYDSLYLTAMVETDARLSVQVDLQDAASRVLYIDVPDAVAWYVVPGTVIDVKGADKVEHEGGFMRNDVARLHAIASFAAAWYGKSRQTIDLTIKTLSISHPVGSLIVAASSGGYTIPIRTAVTSREWDFVHGTTRIKTGFDELRFKDLVT